MPYSDDFVGQHVKCNLGNRESSLVLMSSTRVIVFRLLPRICERTKAGCTRDDQARVGTG